MDSLESLTSTEIICTDRGLPAPSRMAQETHLIGPVWARIAITIGACISASSGLVLALVGILR